MDPTGASGLPFIIQACGRFAPPCVRIEFDATGRPTTPELEAAIAAEWDRQVALAHGTDRVLFNGELLRYLRHALVPGSGGETFALTVGPTCYRDFIGTNLFNKHRLAEFGWESFANPVGTTATLLTSDGRICYGRRSSRVSYHAAHVHTFGGALEPADVGDDGGIDAFASVARELEEELALRRDELLDLVCVGMIRDREIHQPEMLFEARLDMTAEELRRRWERAEAKDEHDEIVTLVDEPDAIVPFIKSCGPIAPVAVGALFVHGRLHWSEAWLRNAIEKYGRAIARNWSAV